MHDDDRVDCLDCLHYGFSKCQVGQTTYYPKQGHLCPRFDLDPIAEYERESDNLQRDS